MTEQPDGGVTMRRAVMADRDELLTVLTRAFSRDEAHPIDFLSFVPHVFTPERIGDHLLYLEGGRILGCLGLYPYEMRVGGVSFRAAALGQVATLPEARGRGVMSALLSDICRDADAAAYDFCWLGGDRTRYGRHGWAIGGMRLRFWFPARYLPDPPDESWARPLDPARDFELVRDHLAQDADTVVADDVELRRILEGEATGGWVAGDSFVIHRRGLGNVHLGRGAVEQIGRLLACHLRWLGRQPAWRGDLVVECAAAPSDLLRAAHVYHAGMTVEPSGMFRLGPLRPFLEKACRVAQPGIACGSGRVSLANADTGETATITCTNGRLAVRDGAGDAPHFRLGRKDLSEACFGLCPLDVCLPGLPADSLLRRVLPLRACWSRFFGL
ncbi:MAG: GNAT family N-acetyltransferase [Candidatus Brocadiaceae bacterium]|nr:GNAT family N-acetyltransferase [Candidatus Brocadiaceae bacterium]